MLYIPYAYANDDDFPSLVLVTFIVPPLIITFPVFLLLIPYGISTEAFAFIVPDVIVNFPSFKIVLVSVVCNFPFDKIVSPFSKLCIAPPLVPNIFPFSLSSLSFISIFPEFVNA